MADASQVFHPGLTTFGQNASTGSLKSHRTSKVIYLFQKTTVPQLTNILILMSLEVQGFKLILAADDTQ